MTFARAVAALLLADFAAAVEPLRLHGSIAAAFTPYKADGSIDANAVPAQAAYMSRTGVKGILVAGTTGDSVSMSVAERMTLAEAWAGPAATHNFTLLVHIGAEALSDVLALATHAENLGAAALVCMPSVFFKPAGVDGIALWFQRIASSAPRTPLYYYHIPSMTGVNFRMLDLIQATERVGVPTFVGVKYTGLYEQQAWKDFQDCQHYKDGKYDIYCGREEMTVQALSIGTRGFIGSQFNFAGDLYAQVRAAWPDSVRATELQGLALDLLETWGRGIPDGVNGNRLVMEFAGVPMGPPRLPSLPVDESVRNAQQKNLGDWCQRASLKLHDTVELCKRWKHERGLPTALV